MNWNVTYRGKDGRQETIQIESDDRQGVFAELARRGISAIRIEDAKGKAKPRMAAVATSGSSVLFKGVIASVAVVAIAGAAWLLFSHRESLPEEKVERKTGKISEVSPSLSMQSDVASTADGEESIRSAPEKLPLPTTNVITARSSRVGRVMTLMDGTVVTNTPQVIFERDFERGLMVALRPGGMTGGIFRLIRSRYSDEEILSMLKEMTVPDPDDDDSVRRTKENVQALKERALIAISEGSSVSQVLDEIQRQGTLENLMKADAMKLRAEAVRTGDPQLIRNSMAEINRVLEENGIRKLDTPMQYAEPEDAASLEDDDIHIQDEDGNIVAVQTDEYGDSEDHPDNDNESDTEPEE